jgi:hypothetical protein
MSLAEDLDDVESSIALNAIASTFSLTSTSKLKKTSPVHEHCRAPTQRERQEKTGLKWIWCKHCTNSSYSAQSTTNMRNHLIRVHEIDVSLSTPTVRTIATESINALYAKLLLSLGAIKNTLTKRYSGEQLIKKLSTRLSWI